MGPTTFTLIFSCLIFKQREGRKKKSLPSNISRLLPLFSCLANILKMSLRILPDNFCWCNNSLVVSYKNFNSIIHAFKFHSELQNFHMFHSLSLIIHSFCIGITAIFTTVTHYTKHFCYKKANSKKKKMKDHIRRRFLEQAFKLTSPSSGDIEVHEQLA